MSDEHTYRKNIRPGLPVEIVEKHNQRTGILTTGEVGIILSPGQRHPRGIKVRLSTGQVGRVQRIMAKRD